MRAEGTQLVESTVSTLNNFLPVIPAPLRALTRNPDMQDYGTAVALVSGQQQLQWLHLLHTSIDTVLRGLRATKVDSSGTSPSALRSLGHDTDDISHPMPGW